MDENVKKAKRKLVLEFSKATAQFATWHFTICANLLYTIYYISTIYFDCLLALTVFTELFIANFLILWPIGPIAVARKGGCPVGWSVEIFFDRTEQGN